MQHTNFRSVLLLLALFLAGLSSPLAAQGNKPYKGAEIYTTQAYKYGKFEMRMRMAKGNGLLSTFFTYKEGSEKPGTFWEEIDIEVFGKKNATEWQSNILVGQGSAPTDNDQQVHEFCKSLGDGYHTYTLEWRPGQVRWLLDGKLIYTKNGGVANQLTSGQSLRFNIWAAFQNQFPEVGPFDANAVPRYQFVNWIKYYAWNGSGFAGSPTWTDNFSGSSLNPRWGKANWTFGANRADFSPNNVVVKNGYLVLAFTRAGATGYNGNPPTDSGTQTCAGGGGGGGGGTNSITSLSAPGSVARGGNITASFNFSSNGNGRDILVQLQKDSPPWTVYASKRVQVNTGTGRRSVTLTAPGNLPIANNNLQVQVVLTTRNGGWAQRFANQAKNNINGVAAGGGGGGGGGGQVVANGTYNFKATNSNQNMGAFSWNNHSARMINAGNFADQKWDVTHLGGNVYHIKNVGTNRFLEVPFARCGNGNNVATYTSGAGNHQRWFIERSAGGSFILRPNHCRSQAADRAFGAANANVGTYSYSPGNGNLRFRIVPVSKSDFSTALTPPPAAGRAAAELDAVLTPNPAYAGQSTLRLTLPAEGELSVSLISVSGRQLASYTTQAPRGELRLGLAKLTGADRLAPGAYLVRVATANESLVRRLVIR